MIKMDIGGKTCFDVQFYINACILWCSPIVLYIFFSGVYLRVSSPQPWRFGGIFGVSFLAKYCSPDILVDQSDCRFLNVASIRVLVNKLWSYYMYHQLQYKELLSQILRFYLSDIFFIELLYVLLSCVVKQKILFVNVIKIVAKF